MWKKNVHGAVDRLETLLRGIAAFSIKRLNIKVEFNAYADSFSIGIGSLEGEQGLVLFPGTYKLGGKGESADMVASAVLLEWGEWNRTGKGLIAEKYIAEKKAGK